MQRKTDSANNLEPDSLEKVITHVTCGMPNRQLRRDLRDGFLQSGLFYYCRHPAYFAEQSIWVVVYLFTLLGGKTYFTWNGSVLGCVLLVLLFQGSMQFSESITAGKYPNYIEYQARTSKCVPLRPAGRTKEGEEEARAATSWVRVQV